MGKQLRKMTKRLGARRVGVATAIDNRKASNRGGGYIDPKTAGSFRVPGSMNPRKR